MHFLRFGLTAGAAGFLILAASCREPTQITIAITTDVPCSDVKQAGGVAVRVGSNLIVAPDCAGSGDIGTLAIVPSKSEDDQVTIEVSVASQSAPVSVPKSLDCKPSKPGNCIIAKRVLRYIPHTALSLPIHLSLKCAGVTCDDPKQTCIDGICQGAIPECPPDQPCNIPPPVPDGGPISDGGKPDVILSSDGGVTDVQTLDACFGTSCNGKCVDLQTNPDNCGACGLVCTGTCVAGACKLAANPTTGDTCIAVGTDIVGWTHSAAASWVPRTGGSNTNKFTALTTPGDIMSGGGMLSFVGLNSPNSIGREVTSVQPPTSIGTFDVTLPDANRWVARSAAGVQCYSYRQGNVDYVTCPNKFQKVPLPAVTPGPLVVGANLWAIILDPEKSTTTIQPGTMNGTLQQTIALPGARTMTVNPGTDQTYVAVGTKIVVSSANTFVDVWSGTDQVRGLRVDSKGTLYFVETNLAKSTIRKLSYTGTPVPSNQSPILRTDVVDQLGPIACIDVDGEAVYYVSAGMPTRIPK